MGEPVTWRAARARWAYGRFVEGGGAAEPREGGGQRELRREGHFQSFPGTPTPRFMYPTPPAPPPPGRSESGRAGNRPSPGGDAAGIFGLGESPWAAPPGGEGAEVGGASPGTPSPPVTPPRARARSPRGRQRAGLGGAGPGLLFLSRAPPSLSPSPNPSRAEPQGGPAARGPIIRPRPKAGPIPSLGRRPFSVSPRALGRPGAAGKLSRGRGVLAAGERSWGSGVCTRGGDPQPSGAGRLGPRSRAGIPRCPGPVGSRPAPDCRPRRGDAARARAAREWWAEGRQGRRPSQCRQVLPALRLPHPDHESATVGKINFIFASAALVTQGMRWPAAPSELLGL